MTSGYQSRWNAAIVANVCHADQCTRVTNAVTHRLPTLESHAGFASDWITAMSASVVKGLLR